MLGEATHQDYIFVHVQSLLCHQGHAAIIALTRAMRDKTDNLPPMPGVFPDYSAPIIRNAPDGVRELTLARWGMPGPPQFKPCQLEAVHTWPKADAPTVRLRVRC
jgi:hypothetical protein